MLSLPYGSIVYTQFTWFLAAGNRPGDGEGAMPEPQAVQRRGRGAALPFLLDECSR